MALSFLPSWLQWWPGSSEAHWVVMLGDDYDYAVVSGPDRGQVWVLARTRTLGRARYAGIVQRLRRAHYPVDRLVPTPQHVSPWEALVRRVASPMV